MVPLHGLVVVLIFGMFTSRTTTTVTATANPQIQQAITRCRDKLSQDPTFPKAQHMLGMLLEATDTEISGSDLEEIAELSYQAGVDDERPLEASSRVDALVRAGKAYLELGHIDRAINGYQRALALVEDQALAETILRQVTPLFFREDQHTTTMESALDVFNLASLLTRKFPSSSVTHQFQGAVFRKAANMEAAYQSYHMATTLASSDSESESQSTKIESLILAASAARQAGRDLDTQMRYLQKALEIDNSNSAKDLQAEVWNNMGIAYKAAGQKEQAIDSFQSALTAKPGDGHALAQLASLDSQSQSATAFDANYVQGLFDGYSSRFENELVNTLHYKGHCWVADELINVWDRETPAIIVDLGCGTGLVGEVLASQLKLATPPNLVGVDLSGRMVELARVRTLSDTRRVYQKVLQEDAETFLKGLAHESIDAVVAADVFIYIGDLEGVFSACWNVLGLAGWLVFSVELTKEGMVLLPSGRFGHSKGYIRDLAKQSGFDLKLWKEGVLRKQHGAPVKGAVVVLQKQN